MTIAETIIYLATYKGEDTPAKLIRRLVKPEDAGEILKQSNGILRAAHSRALTVMFLRHTKAAQRFANFCEDAYSRVGKGGAWARVIAKELREKYNRYSTKGRVIEAARTFADLRVIKLDTGTGESIGDAIFRASRIEQPAPLEDAPLL